jgi:hypothetical protein
MEAISEKEDENSVANPLSAISSKFLNAYRFRKGTHINTSFREGNNTS